MKVLRKYDQFRRDCSCDLECEKCGSQETKIYAYDDRNYWDNVIPSRECKKCGESTKSLGLNTETIPTKYNDYEVI